MLKTDIVSSLYEVVAQHKLAGFESCRGREQGGGRYHHTPDNLDHGQGSADIITYYYILLCLPA